ncbi:MAG: hypothetical protein AAGJ80_03325, partial [Cyanobacteria bacterium J06553_1]
WIAPSKLTYRLCCRSYRFSQYRCRTICLTVATSISGSLKKKEYLYADCPWTKRMVNAGDLTAWVDAMKQVVPLEAFCSK